MPKSKMFSDQREQSTVSKHIWIWVLMCLIQLPFWTHTRSLMAASLSAEETVKLLRLIDERQRNVGDYKALAYIERKARGRADVVQEGLIFRRDADEKLMIIYTKPKTEQGKGYLRIDRNLWYYDPGTGRWERRTDREQLGGTNALRQDFDRSRLAEEYDPTFEGEDKLGNFAVYKLKLRVKSGVTVAYPVVELWIDKESSNILKRQEFALSGRLMRTSYYPKWQKIESKTKGEDVWYPQEMRFFDEVEKSSSTLVLIRSIDLQPLNANVFTKAWLESKSR